jgi:hypothetical protein
MLTTNDKNKKRTKRQTTIYKISENKRSSNTNPTKYQRFSGRMGLEEIISKDEKAVDGYHVIHILLQTQRIQVMSKSKDL